jgi:hypothetical protein
MTLLTLTRPGHDPLQLKRGKTLALDVKAAFFYPYPDGWQFYPLASDKVPALHNGRPCETGRPLAVDDKLQLGRVEFLVETAEIDPESQSRSHEMPPACWLSVNGGRVIPVRKQVLIGSDPVCRIRIPEKLGAEPVHALLVAACGQWWLHDLSGRKIAREHQQPERTLIVADNDKILIGQTAIRFYLGELDEETAARESSSENLSIGDTALSGTKPPSSHSVLLAGSRVFASAEAFQRDPIYAKAWDLVQWLQKELRTPPTADGGAHRPAPKGKLSGVINWLGARRRTPVETLAEFREQFTAQPRDRDQLMEFARFLETQGYADLCRVVLKELYGLNPRDRLTLRALARGYLNLARDQERPQAERTRAFQQAEEFAQKGLALDANDRDLAEIQREAGAELTILQGHLMGAARPTRS